MWNLLSGISLVFVVSNLFTPVEQGVFYTFLSLAAAQYFFDLGVGFVLANLAGRNTPDDQEGIEYNENELAYVRASVRFGLKWSCLAGFVLMLVLGGVGYLIFSNQQPGVESIQLIWLSYVVLVACAMSFHLFLRLFEGLGFVVEAAIARSIQSFINIVVIYLLAIGGFGIVAMPVALFVGLAFAFLYFVFSSSKIRSAFTELSRSKKTIGWRKEVWPFQSRVAVSWIAGYIIFQSQTPILFSLSDAVEAGRFGVAVQIFQALNTSANIFLTYNVREWTRFSSNDELRALNKSFFKTLFLTVGLMALGCASVLLGLLFVQNMGWQMAERFPDMTLLILFSIAATFNQVFFCLGYYFRARGKEPLWRISVLAALLILAVPLVLWTDYDITAATWSFFAVSVVVLGILSPIFSYFLVRGQNSN